MLRGGDARNALRKLVDEIITLVLVVASQVLDALAHIAILKLVEMHQGHRMNLNAIGNDEFNTRKADSVARQFPPAERAARAGDVEHDRCARVWQFFKTDFFLYEIEQAIVNETFIALGA